MSTMVERVARALTETQIRSANELFKLSDPRRVKTEEQIVASIEAGWRMNEKDARAAIEAMMEPSDEMLDKMNDVWVDAGEVAINVCFEDLRDLFRVGIQAALKEQA